MRGAAQHQTDHAPPDRMPLRRLRLRSCALWPGAWACHTSFDKMRYGISPSQPRAVMIVATLAASASVLVGSTVSFAPQRTVEPVVQMRDGRGACRWPPLSASPSTPPLAIRRSHLRISDCCCILRLDDHDQAGAKACCSKMRKCYRKSPQILRSQ